MSLIIQCDGEKKNNWQDNHSWFVKLLVEAKENGSLESLIDNLQYLNEYNGSTVTIRAAGDRAEANVAWARGIEVEKPFMWGGLIYFKNGNDWSVHT